MRMWMMSPEILCRQHLLGEHNEQHAFLGHFKLKRRVDGYIKNNLLEPNALKERHNIIANEMIRRGYHHSKDLDFNEDEVYSYMGEEYRNHKIDKKAALVELLRRCPVCKLRFYKMFVLEKRDIKEVFSY